MIVGVDVSSKRIDLAWLEDGRPCRWHQQLDPKAHLIDRLRSIDIRWPRSDAPFPNIHIDDEHAWIGASPGDVTDIAIEYPYAPQRAAIAALMATVGVITRQAPPWARVAWPSSGELRTAIGAPNRKYDAGIHIQTLHNLPHPSDPNAWDEHELDALVACTGWTHLLAQQDAA